MQHADRGRLLLRTSVHVQFVICKCSFVETTDTQSCITKPISDSLVISLVTDFDSFAGFDTTNSCPFPFDMIEYRFPLGICNGCYMLTGDAYPSGHLVPSHLGLAYVLHVETKLILLSNLSFCFRTMHFEYPSELSRVCFVTLLHYVLKCHQILQCIIVSFWYNMCAFTSKNVT